MTPKPADDYVWAYEVHIFARNREDGVRDRIFIVDAQTGAILRSDEGLRNLEPPNPPTQRPTDTAKIAGRKISKQVNAGNTTSSGPRLSTYTAP